MKNPRENQAHNDAMRAVIKMPDDPRIKFCRLMVCVQLQILESVQ